MIDGSLRLFHVGVASNKYFTFPQLKMLRETNNFFAEERTRKNEHGSTFLEAMKLHMTRIQSFCKLKMLKHAQIQSVNTAKCFRMHQSHFLQTQTAHKCSFQQNVFPKNGGKRFALAWTLWAHPHFFTNSNSKWKHGYIFFAEERTSKKSTDSLFWNL